MLKSLAIKLGKFIGIAFAILVVLVSSLVAYTSVQEILKYVGVKKIIVPVVGTGSMYPSLYWAKSEQGPDDLDKTAIEEYRSTPRMYRRFSGLAIFGRIYLYRPVGFGDMVAFKSDTTREILASDGKDQESGFIKRIIGLPGDTLELRDGYVIRNGERIEEPYLYRPRSTYGEEEIVDCQKQVVPPGHYLVLGDNRKISSDSRGKLGFIADSDINYILPFGEQEIYHSLWRDTSQDEKLLGTPTLDSQEFYRLLNLARHEAGVPALAVKTSLIRSASLRGSQVLAGESSSLENTLQKVGYSNIVTGEFISRGHYSAQELVQNLLYFPSTASQVLDPQYQDIGLVTVNQDVSGCPTQLIVGQMGGYIPADYPPEVISGWQDLVTNLEEVISSWEKARDYPKINQDKLNELLTILHTRLTLARAIVSSMQDNKWLTSEQEQSIKADVSASARADKLIEELNGN